MATAQVPAGGEFRVNTYTTSDQLFSAAVLNPGGGFTIAFQDFHGADRTIVARHYVGGTANGPEHPLADTPAHVSWAPPLAANESGAFVAAFGVAGYDVALRRFDAAGQPLGSSFRVNGSTTDRKDQPAVSLDAAGGIVVVWRSFESSDHATLSGRRFDPAGSPRGSEFRIEPDSTDTQAVPSVASSAAGDFVVVWVDMTGAFTVRGQRYDADGQRRGEEFQVSTTPNVDPQAAIVASDATGNFVVVWDAYFPATSKWDVLGRRFAADGTPRGPDFRVNTYTSAYQMRPSLAMDAVGDFVVAWDSTTQDGPGAGVFAQRFDAAGIRRGLEFRVNTFTTGNQLGANVGSDSAGNFVVTWTGAFQDGSGYGVYAQRFGGLVPSALAVDTAGNGVLDPGEVAVLRPSWRNLNGAAQTIGGALSDLAGPAGATYTIVDAAASYGTVPNGAIQGCADCYAVTVAAEPTRPALHWDAAATESITPDSQGQRRRWSLHVGGSFSDVSLASPFYPFIEALLHASVTSGCAAGAYCPAAPTAREQMAVFVLLAKEGSAYSAPACEPPNVFADVPESSPFCRWIEELSARGVVSGCGGGNFCPSAAVTREQMSVFVLRTLDPALEPPACTTAPFSDVPPTSPFCRWIQELARRHIVSGCGGGRYCPADAVTREQMAVFLGATFGLSLYRL